MLYLKLALTHGQQSFDCVMNLMIGNSIDPIIEPISEPIGPKCGFFITFDNGRIYIQNAV